jgi:phosphate:Na+ symporter
LAVVFSTVHATSDPASKRLPLGNLLNRVLGVSAALAALPYIRPWVTAIEPEASPAVTDFHTAFDLILALLFFPQLKKRAAKTRKPQSTNGGPKLISTRQVN